MLKNLKPNGSFIQVRYVVAIDSDDNNDDDDDYDGTDYGGDGDDHDERWTIY